MTGPVDFIDGRFGYFKLFESVDQIDHLLSALGKPYKITEMAHKPYPAGRATQGVLTMIRQLLSEHEFAVTDIEKIKVYVPPLVMLLVGRPPSKDMTPSYARLCLRFVVPLMLIDGDVDPRRYVPDAFSNKRIRDLGDRIEILDDGNPDKNALGPQRMEIILKDGRVLKANCEDPLGSPANPLSKKQREDKVRRCFSLGLDDVNPEPYIQTANRLAGVKDVSVLLDMVS